MSAELLDAIYSACVGSSALARVLAKDPNIAGDPPPAVFLARTSFVPPVFDCLTYSVSSSRPDRRFDAAVQGGESEPVEEYRVDFGYYADGASTASIEAALGSGGILDRLFRFGPGFDLVSGGNPLGRVFRAACITRQTDFFDEKLHKLFGVASYQFYAQFS